MSTAIACLVAAISTAAFLLLWFWVARKELQAKKDMVASARAQLFACRATHEQAEDGDKKRAAKSVLMRSEDIYLQSIELYHQTLKKPWFHVPGRLMGFEWPDEDF